MGWLALFALFAVSLGLLAWMGVRRGMLTAAAATLMLGATGYALQGSPAVPAAPAVGELADENQPLTGARHAFFGNFSAEWCLFCDANADCVEAVKEACVLDGAKCIPLV